MPTFHIVLATVVIRYINFVFGISQFPYIVIIFNEHTRTETLFPWCGGTLITDTWVLTTRFCLPHHAYLIQYGDKKALGSTIYSPILSRRYHPNSYPDLTHRTHKKLKHFTGSNNIALALIKRIPKQRFGILTAIDYTSLIGYEVAYCEFTFVPPHVRLVSNQINQKVYERDKHIKKANTKLKRRLQRNQRASPDNNEVHFGLGLVIPCHDDTLKGPSICVVDKCINTTIPTEEVDDGDWLTPDLGTPLLFYEKIVGLTASTGNFDDDSTLTFTPISPFLSWINSFVKVQNPNKNSTRSRLNFDVVTKVRSSVTKYLPRQRASTRQRFAIWF